MNAYQKLISKNVLILFLPKAFKTTLFDFNFVLFLLHIFGSRPFDQKHFFHICLPYRNLTSKHLIKTHFVEDSI